MFEANVSYFYDFMIKVITTGPCLTVIYFVSTHHIWVVPMSWSCELCEGVLVLGKVVNYGTHTIPRVFHIYPISP